MTRPEYQARDGRFTRVAPGRGSAAAPWERCPRAEAPGGSDQMYATANTVRTGLNPRDASLQTWSTSSVAPDEATAYWRDVVRQLCVQMGLEPTPGTAFCG